MTHDFQRYFPGLSKTLNINFQDFPGPNWFSLTFQVLEFSRKNPGLSRRRGNPVHKSITVKPNSDIRCIPVSFVLKIQHNTITIATNATRQVIDRSFLFPTRIIQCGSHTENFLTDLTGGTKLSIVLTKCICGTLAILRYTNILNNNNNNILDHIMNKILGRQMPGHFFYTSLLKYHLHYLKQLQGNSGHWCGKLPPPVSVEKKFPDSHSDDDIHLNEYTVRELQFRRRAGDHFDCAAGADDYEAADDAGRLVRPCAASVFGMGGASTQLLIHGWFIT